MVCLKSIVHQFLVKRYDVSRPILLALSGGPDSLALFWILNELKEDLGLTFAVAHIDHCWRKSSTSEAQELKQLSESLNLPFHLKTLDPSTLKGNKENACRQERLQFFKTLCRQYGYQAVLLGHHADDQAETVLKRLLEGSSLSVLGALRQEQIYEGMALWRPLLSVSKNEIQKWLTSKSYTALEDETNKDIQYLRAKFRMSIIPSLSKEFGKEITPSLIRIGREAADLTEYLDDKIAPLMANIRVGSFGAMFDLQQFPSIPKIELKHLVLRFLQKFDCALSIQELDLTVELLQSGQANKQIRSAESKIIIDRRRLFILNSLLTQKLQSQELFFGSHHNEEWLIQVAPIRVDEVILNLPTVNWQSAWDSAMEVILPNGDYTLAVAKPNSIYKGSSTLSKLWTDAKVPAFLRSVPVIFNKDTIVHEFLSGHRMLPLKMGSSAIHIKLLLKAKEFSAKIN